MKNAKLLLEQLTILMPPGNDQAHNIVVKDGVLIVSLMLGVTYFPCALSDNDLEKSVSELVAEIYELVR